MKHFSVIYIYTTHHLSLHCYAYCTHTHTASPSDPTLAEGLQWEVLNFQPKVGELIMYEALFVRPPRPPGSAPPPLVVFPHGGPHGVYTASFYLWHSGLALLGYSVLLGECWLLGYHLPLVCDQLVVVNIDLW